MGYNYYLLKLINGITGNIYRNDRVKEIDLRANKKELVYMNASIETEMGLLGLLRHLQGEEQIYRNLVIIIFVIIIYYI